MKTQLYQINVNFARRNNMPSIFAGVVLRETEKAVYVYGHGTMESSKTGSCCVCGRELTHPVSVTLGIGPECGGHWWDWKTIGGYTEENIERLKKEMLIKMKDMKVDQWLPKAVIKEKSDCSTEITIPSDHPMSTEKSETKPKIKRSVILVKFSNTEELGLRVVFPYSPEDVNRVKTLSGRKFNVKGKYWTCYLSEENVKMLEGWNFEMQDKIYDYLVPQEIHIDSLDDSGIQIPGLKRELYPYQKKGVSFIETRKGRALIADEMGLGKTAQALAWLQLHKEHTPVIIVVPASLKLNWEREAHMWMENPNVSILNGTTPHAITTDIAIINYDILASWLPVILEWKPKVMISDEIHYVKNNKAQRTKAAKKLAKHVPYFIGLSGTPIVNRPFEFYNAINMVDKSIFPDFWTYVRRYCNAKNNGFGWDFSGADHMEELHEKLSTSIMIRRKKIDVLTDLPPKTRSFVPIELSNRLEYNRAKNDFIAFVERNIDTEISKLQKELFEKYGTNLIDEEKIAEMKAEKIGRISNAQVLVEIEGLKQLAVRGKMNSVIDWITDFLESGEKLVLFAVHKFVIEQVMQKFKGIAVKIDGSVSGENRQVAVDKFQNDPSIKLFVGNIKAAGVGLTLTSAANVAFIELPWTPGDLEQAIDRCHRIGQKDAVNAHFLLAENTIEEEIADLLDNKRKVLEAVLDGQKVDQSSLIGDLIANYKK